MFNTIEMDQIEEDFLRRRFIKASAPLTRAAGEIEDYVRDIEVNLTDTSYGAPYNRDKFRQLMHLHRKDLAFEQIKEVLMARHKAEIQKGLELFDSEKWKIAGRLGHLNIEIEPKLIYHVDLVNLACSCPQYLFWLKDVGLICEHIVCLYSIANLILSADELPFLVSVLPTKENNQSKLVRRLTL